VKVNWTMLYFPSMPNFRLLADGSGRISKNDPEKVESVDENINDEELHMDLIDPGICEKLFIFLLFIYYNY
ncbi:hypothetical protein ACDT12_13715, partial [Staphylococcus aureus]